MNLDALPLMTCFNCGAEFRACNLCCNAIRIDPATGLPPDAAVQPDGSLRHDPDANPNGYLRAILMPVCDKCVDQRNEVYLQTQMGLTEIGAHIPGMWERWVDRHRRGERH